MLEGKACLLREKGLAKKPNKTNRLTRQKEDILWECGQLGDKTPKSFSATFWWQLTQRFGLQGRQEHHSMRVEDFLFKINSESVLTLSWSFFQILVKPLYFTYQNPLTKFYVN